MNLHYLPTDITMISQRIAHICSRATYGIQVCSCAEKSEPGFISGHYQSLKPVRDLAAGGRQLQFPSSDGHQRAEGLSSQSDKLNLGMLMNWDLSEINARLSNYCETKTLLCHNPFSQPTCTGLTLSKHVIAYQAWLSTKGPENMNYCSEASEVGDERGTAKGVFYQPVWLHRAMKL